MFKINIIFVLLFILFVYGNGNMIVGMTSARNKINTCITNEYKNMDDIETQRSKIIEKLDMIIKFKGMNKTDEEIKEELKIFGIIIRIIIGIAFIIISCID